MGTAPHTTEWVTASQLRAGDRWLPTGGLLWGSRHQAEQAAAIGERVFVTITSIDRPSRYRVEINDAQDVLTSSAPQSKHLILARTTESQEDTMTDSKTTKPAAPKRRRTAAAKPAAESTPTQSKGLREYQSRRAAAAAKRAQSAEAPAAEPTVTPAGPSQADIDDAVVALVDELGGTVADDVKARVAARAAEVAAEQAAAPAPAKKGALSPEAQAERDAKRQAQADRIGRVIEARKNGVKLADIAKAEGYGSGDAVGDVLKRYAPELVVPRGTSRALVLTDEQMAALTALATATGASVSAIARAYQRQTA